jgi:hypothetical protein
MSTGPLSFLVSLLAGQRAVGWLIFLDKALLALLLLGGIGISLQESWGRWLVVSSLSIGLIIIVTTALRYIENIVSKITQHAYLAMTDLSIVVPALLILLSAFFVKVPQSEAATSNAVDGAKKIRLLSMLYTVHLCFALPCAMLGGIYLLEYSGTKEMLAMMLGIPLVMSLPVLAFFSLLGIGLSVMYEDMSLATLSVLAVLCLMLFVFLGGRKVPEYVLDFAVVLYIILSIAFSIRWFYAVRPRLRQQMRANNPKDINPLP